ncbi:MAG: TonB family protein [Prevotella sp.]|nr:TonB family protein [Prevotella sp.]MBO4658637.1 TonB family protein [Prevotella sp.]
MDSHVEQTCKIPRAMRLLLGMVGVSMAFLLTACESQMMDLDAIRGTTTAASQTPVTTKIFDDYEQRACFPGGEQALLAFLDKNVRYPKDYEGCAQGRVVVSVVVDIDGSIIEPKVEKSVCKELDAEALRVVGLMPKWIPAKYYGKGQKEKVCIPITFKLR